MAYRGYLKIHKAPFDFISKRVTYTTFFPIPAEDPRKATAAYPSSQFQTTYDLTVFFVSINFSVLYEN